MFNININRSMNHRAKLSEWAKEAGQDPSRDPSNLFSFGTQNRSEKGMSFFTTKGKVSSSSLS